MLHYDNDADGDSPLLLGQLEGAGAGASQPEFKLFPKFPFPLLLSPSLLLPALLLPRLRSPSFHVPEGNFDKELV